MMILSFPAEAGGALPDSVDGAGRPQSTRVTQLGALMNKFSSDSIQFADNQVGMSYPHKSALFLPGIPKLRVCSVDPRVWCRIFCSHSVSPEHATVTSGQDSRWPRRLIVTGGMQNILAEDGVDFDGDAPIIAENVHTHTHTLEPTTCIPGARRPPRTTPQNSLSMLSHQHKLAIPCRMSVPDWPL
jgi:hypothetical protein